MRPLQPPPLRRARPRRPALSEGHVPDRPLEDAAVPRDLRLHRGALPRRVPGRPAGPPLHARGPRGRPGGGRPDHPPRQPAAGGPRPGLRPPLRAHLHPDPPRRAAGDPPDQAVHHGAGGVAGGRADPAARRWPSRGGHRGRAGRAGRGGVAGPGRRRRDDPRGASLPRRHGRRCDPRLPPAPGPDRPGPRGPRASRRRDPPRRARRARRDGGRPPCGGLLRGRRDGRRPAGEAARPRG